jgi:hypothetical protein
MQSKKLAKKKPGVPTQRLLDIAEIRDDVITLKDGTMRAVLLVSSINFALKSQDEQQAIIQSYMQFLNGLDYSLQIVIHSRKMNIDNYLNSLKEQEKKIENELLINQIRDYSEFVSELVELGEIMSKRFYMIVPFDPLTSKQRGFFARLKSAVTPAVSVKLKEKQFQERRHELMQRVEIIQSGLNSMSLQGVVLDTQSLIELYYSVYNPSLAETQKMADINKLQVEES